jgi:hypothetical protein
LSSYNPHAGLCGVDQSDLLLGWSDTGRRDALLTFVGPDLVAARWKQFRTYFADVAPGRSGWEGAHLLSGTGSSAAPMNGYPKVFNIESDPREEHNIGALYEWVIGPTLKVVEEYKTIRNIEGMSGQVCRSFINNLVESHSDARYLEP